MNNKIIKAATFATATLLLISPTILSAQNSCSEHPAIAEYINTRTTHIPLLQNMSREQSEAIELMYLMLIEPTIDQISYAYLDNGEEKTYPSIYNHYNYSSIINGDKYGIIGSYAEAIIANAGADVINEIHEELDLALSSIERSSLHYAAYIDKSYRIQTSSILDMSGCPSDLHLDYGIPPINQGINNEN